MNFLIYLALITQNPEFVAALTDLIKDTKIDITIMDNILVNANAKYYIYTLNDKRLSETPVTTIESPMPDQQYVYSSYDTSELDRSTIIEVIPTFKPTYIQTWFSEQTIEYNSQYDSQDTIRRTT